MKIVSKFVGAALMFFGSIGCAAASDLVGNFTVGTTLMTSLKAEVYAVPDPVVRGITCHVQVVARKGFTLAADPSNSSIACRQTGPMFAEDLAKIKKGAEGEDIFSMNRGSGLGRGPLLPALLGLFKELHVQRIWDEQSKTFLYVTFTDKLYDGTPKTSLSTVPTYGQPGF